MTTQIKIGLIQMSAESRPEANLKKALAKIEAAARKGARIICLQELFHTRYFCRSYSNKNFALAETASGPVIRQLSQAAKAHQTVIIAPFFEKRSAGIYHNSALVLDADGSLAGHYRKMHIPDDPNFYEKYYFTPGDLGFRAVQTRYAKIGVLICWDQWFPEAARLTALAGAQILFYPTAIGRQMKESAKTAAEQYAGWEIVQRGHAVANEVFVAVVNRVGQEGPIRFWGKSFVSDPFGAVIRQAGGTREENLIVSCDLGRIEAIRQAWPFLRDRRIDAYQGILKRSLGS